MALAGTLTLTFILHMQITFGQQFNMGSVELSKLPIHQIKDTESLTVAKNFENIVKIQKMRHNENLKSDTFYNLNKTETKTGDETMTNVNFLRNQFYSLPATTLTMINRNTLAPQSLFDHPIAAPITPHIESNTNQVKPAPGETIIKQTETETHPQSKSPLYAAAGAQSPAAPSLQSLHLARALPTLSSVQFVPNVVSLQTITAPSQIQAPHQSLSSLLIQPSNVQSPVKYIQVVPGDVSTQKAIDNIVQNRQSMTSLLLSHILSQNFNAQDPLTPVQTHTNRNSKQLNNKTLLPLLLKLLKEMNKTDCKSGRSHIHNGLKRGKLDDVDINSLEMNSESDTSEHMDRACELGGDRARDSGGEEDDYYSDESSDYTGENYDDD